MEGVYRDQELDVSARRDEFPDNPSAQMRGEAESEASRSDERRWTFEHRLHSLHAIRNQIINRPALCMSIDPTLENLGESIRAGRTRKIAVGRARTGVGSVNFATHRVRRVYAPIK